MLASKHKNKFLEHIRGDDNRKEKYRGENEREVGTGDRKFVELANKRPESMSRTLLTR